MPDKIYTDAFESVLGKFHLAATDKGLQTVMLPNVSQSKFVKLLKENSSADILKKGNQHTKEAKKQLREYFQGKRQSFNVKLDFQLTPFQTKALKQVAKIKYGQVKTYGEIAKTIKSPKAFRAVGSANAKNPLPIFIPCHRVVATTGLGGYAGGLGMKKKLMKLENIDY